MNDKHPWAELIAAADARIASAERGDDYSARDILKVAILGLDDVTAGRSPDPERIAYLQFIRSALVQILEGSPPDKALCLWVNNRPKSVHDTRDAALFFNVGQKLDRPDEAGGAKSVKAAIGEVAKHFHIGDETVRKAWQSHGAAEGWAIARDGSLDCEADDLVKGK